MTPSTPPLRSYNWYSWLALCAIPLVWLALRGIDRVNTLVGAHSPPPGERQQAEQPPRPPPEPRWHAPEAAPAESLTERNIQAAHAMSLRFPARSRDLLRVLHASESCVVTTQHDQPVSYLAADGTQLRSHPWPPEHPMPTAARIDIHGYTGPIPESIAFLLEYSPDPQRQKLNIVFGEPLLLRLIAAAQDPSAPSILAVVPTKDPPGFGLIAAE